MNFYNSRKTVFVANSLRYHRASNPMISPTVSLWVSANHEFVQWGICSAPSTAVAADFADSLRRVQFLRIKPRRGLHKCAALASISLHAKLRYLVCAAEEPLGHPDAVGARVRSRFLRRTTRAAASPPQIPKTARTEVRAEHNPYHSTGFFIVSEILPLAASTLLTQTVITSLTVRISLG